MEEDTKRAIEGLHTIVKTLGKEIEILKDRIKVLEGKQWE